MALGTAKDGQCNQENTLNKSEKSLIDSMPTSNSMEEINSKKGKIGNECLHKVLWTVVCLSNEKPRV